MDKKYYTYCHCRNDTNKIFYIGKGTGKRAWWKHARNNYWHKIVNKHGYTVQILSYWDTEDEALDHERLLISCFKDMGYELVNFTDGGDGISGYKHTEETKKKLSEIGKKLYSDPNHVQKMTTIRQNQWTQKARQKASESSKNVWNDDAKKKHSEKLKQSYSTDEMRKMQADRNREFRESIEGRKLFSERVKKYWTSPKSQTEEAKKMRSEKTKKGWKTRRAKNANKQ